MGVTSKARATAACDSPRANRRAASNRRASSAATSAFLAMYQHGIVAQDVHNFIPRDSLVGAERVGAKVVPGIVPDRVDVVRVVLRVVVLEEAFAGMSFSGNPSRRRGT